ncbi:MAG: ROK family transcriptional regulator [Spirochaetota bacterium]
MKRITTGDGDLIRNLNLGIVLDTIRENKSVSRAQISKLTGLSRSTCSLLVDQLLRSGLIVEIGKDESSGGRKPVLLQVNYDAGRAIGVKLMQEKIIAALVDLQGRVVKIVETPVPQGKNQPEYIRFLTGAIRKLITYEKRRKNGRKLLGIGIGMSGLIDFETGTSLHSTILGWENVPLRDILEKEFSIPVYLENDVNTFTIGEKWFSAAKTRDSFLCVTIGRGVGGGFIIDGKLYRGCHHGAGELGHMKISETNDAPVCSCGKRGCLEAYVSDPAICSYVKSGIDAGRRSLLSGEKEIHLKMALEAAKQNDELCLEAFRRAGRYLGIGISNLINIFDPEMIIISGEGTAAGDFIFPEMRAAVSENSVYDLHKKVRIVELLYEDDMWVRGVATLVVREVFKIPF